MPDITLAKLTRPRLYRPVERERLFAQLDSAREHPAVWLSGPPGAGKTTLVASYLEARALSGVWYQVDRGDADPAAFFHYLSHAVENAAPRDGESAMPLFQHEHLTDLSGFARRFFREAYHRLGAPLIVVLDNYQEVALDASLHAILGSALEEAPSQVNLIVISRAGPPAQSARHLANGAISQIDAASLQLSLEETAAMAAVSHSLDAATLDAATLAALHARANGWAAGVVLMSDHARRAGTLEHVEQSDSMETVFAYFAEEILNQAAPDMRRFLLYSALLPQITAPMAQALCPDVNAAELLDDLYRRHWFTDRRAGTVVSFQYHALFREFLLARAETSLPADEFAAIRRRAADLLAGQGQPDAAIALLKQIGDWAALTGLVAARGTELMTQGRYSTLLDWIEGVPEAVLRQTPWLLFWRGRARLPVEPAASLPDLIRAFALFRDGREPLGLFSAWSSIGNAIVWDIAGDQQRLDAWMAIFEELLADYPDYAHPATDWPVAYTAFCNLYLRQPRHPRIDFWKQRALELARRSGEVTQLLPALHMALLLNLLRGDHARAAIEMADYPKVGEVNQNEAHTALLYFGRAYFESRMGDFATCLETVDQAIATAEQSGIRGWLHQVLAHGISAALSLGDHPRALQLLAQLAADPRSRAGHSGSYYRTFACWCALAQGEIEAAWQHATAAVAFADAVGATYLRGVSRFALALAQHARGDRDAAHASLAAATGIARSAGSRILDCMCSLSFADFEYAAGRQAAGDAALAVGLRLGRDERYLSFVCWRRAAMARQCARALEIGVEPEYVHYLIRARKLFAPTPEVEDWPWPVKVYTLGRFSLVVDGEPVAFARKAQKKPLELLQALIALGGRDIDEMTLAQALAEDGGDSLKTLDMTLLRLRKLLGQADAVVLSRGKFSLDTRLCWVDAWAFERRLGALDAADACPDALQKTLQLYRGPLFAREAERAWMLAPRARLHAKFLRGLRRHGDRLEAGQHWESAAHSYQSGIDADPANEELYRGLMRCHAARGESAEAMKVYQRCRSMLSMLLGIAPGAETETLRRKLLASGDGTEKVGPAGG
jgi:DNA-binding SARP family transcriptional activator